MLGRKGLSYKLYIKRDTCSTTPPLTTLHSSLTPYCSNTPDDSHHLALASPSGDCFPVNGSLSHHLQGSAEVSPQQVFP